MKRTQATPLAEVHAAYLQARGRATSASTRRLRWALRRLPRDSGDHVALARRKAIRAELAWRDEVPT